MQICFSIFAMVGFFYFSVSVARISILFKKSTHLVLLIAPWSLIISFLMLRFLSLGYVYVIVGVLGLSLSPIRHIRRIYFEKRMHESLLGLLDEVILSMRSGHSLRISLEIVGNRHPGLIGHIFIEIARRLEHGSGSDGLHGISLELMTEFARAHQSNVKIIDQICLYRRTCRIKSNFRRKSGQVTAQTRMQSVLTCVLYAPLLGFYIFSVQQPFSSRLFLSVGLFSVAQVWIHFGSRRVKWCI